LQTCVINRPEGLIRQGRIRRRRRRRQRWLCDCEDCFPLGCIVMWLGSSPIFRRKILPPFSGWYFPPKCRATPRYIQEDSSLHLEYCLKVYLIHYCVGWFNGQGTSKKGIVADFTGLYGNFPGERPVSRPTFQTSQNHYRFSWLLPFIIFHWHLLFCNVTWSSGYRRGLDW
jgi:hypothetical protein